jgi:hypothetical protein
MFCTKCGKRMAAGSSFCTGCGARLSGPQDGGQTSVKSGPPNPGVAFHPDPVASGGSRGSSSPFFDRRIKYLVIAVGVIAVLAVGTVVGVLIARSGGGDSDGVPATSTSAAGTDDALPSSTTSSLQSLVTTVAPSTTTIIETTTTAAPPTTVSPAASDDWPEIDGWTVIVANFAVDDPSGESQARALRDDMRSNGYLDGAGIIYSTGYSSLKPGWWAVFSGVFDTKSEAIQYQNYLIEFGYTIAYAREVIR